MNESQRTLITRIHATPIPTVIEFAGAGSAALWHLHAVAGSSRTILEASDRYAPQSMESLIGKMPAHFVSLDTAVAMAWAAYRRACDLNPTTANNGVGCTATIATDRLKKGNHGCWVALADRTGVTAYGLTLTKGLRDRAGEENIVSDLIIHVMARARGIIDTVALALGPDESLVCHHVAQRDALAAFVANESACIRASGQHHFEPVQIRGATILSGSFNPLHAGHRALLTTAMAYTYQSGYYELSVVNADKPPLPYTTILARSQQFSGDHPLLLSKAPRFVDKAALYPESTFVVGYDTAIRLLDAKYYGSGGVDDALQSIAHNGCRFLVAGRIDAHGVFLQLDRHTIPSQWQHLFVLLDEQSFRRDISSTNIRAGIQSKDG
jgi:hypothetical protein